MWQLLMTREARWDIEHGDAPEPEELRLAEDLDLRLDRLLNGEQPFAPGEDVPPLNRDLVEIAKMLRKVMRARAPA